MPVLRKGPDAERPQKAAGNPAVQKRNRRPALPAEGFEGAEAAAEFGAGEGAVAEERAEEVGGGGFAFGAVAFVAAGNGVVRESCPSRAKPHDKGER